MDKNFKNITKYVKYGIAVLGGVFAVVQFLDFWGIYDFSGIGVIGIIILENQYLILMEIL